MSSLQIILLSAIGAYFLVMILIGLLASRKQDHEGFVIGNRNVGYIPTMGSVASSFRDGSGIVFWVGFGLVTGYGGLWVFIGSTVGFLFYGLFANRCRKISEEKGYLTVGDMLRDNTGPITEKLASLIIVSLALVGVAMQLYVSGNLISIIIDIPAWTGVFSVATVVALYLFFGGYESVIKTDAIQFFLILSLIIVSFSNPPPIESITNFASLGALGWRDSLVFFTFGFAYAFAMPDGWQRVFSARSSKVIVIAFPLAGLFMIIMTISLLFLGMSAKPFLPDMEANDVFFAIFENQVFSVPILAFIAVVTMAITMSTLDTYTYVFTSSLTRNFLPQQMTESRNRYIYVSRILFLIVLITMSILALTISDIIEVLFSVTSVMAILGPVYIFTALGYFSPSKRTDIITSLCITVSLTVYAVFYFKGYMDDYLYLLIPTGLCFCFCILSVYGLKYMRHLKN
jgi:SSS family solute:Na+ symporter